MSLALVYYLIFKQIIYLIEPILFFSNGLISLNLFYERSSNGINIFCRIEFLHVSDGHSQATRVFCGKKIPRDDV